MISLNRQILTVLALLVLPSVVWAQSQTRPGSSSTAYNQELEIGPVVGLTSTWHLAPKETAVPLGATLQFRARNNHGAIQWTGAQEFEWKYGMSTAQVRLTSPGSHLVSIEYTDYGGEVKEEQALLHVIDTVAFPLKISNPRISTSPLLENENLSNQETMDYFFSGSIANVRKTEERHYLTSTKRWFRLEVDVEPSGFAPLVEWRLNGRAQRHLGTTIKMQVFPVREHSIQVGSEQHMQEIHLETYRVRITSHESGLDEVPDFSPVTFSAVTEPPGYEGEITWLASTKYGVCDPWMGKGPEFTTHFVGTHGLDRRWLGVRADNAVFDKDGKQRCFGDQECQFMGFDHRALGGTKLAIEEDTLVASNFGNSGDDGVLIDLGGSAQSWRGLLSLELPISAVVPTNMEQAAINVDDEIFSTWNLDLQPGGQIGASADFRSSTYRMEVLRDGEVVFSAPSFPSGPTVSTHITFPCEFFFEYCSINSWINFKVNGGGECEWNQQFFEPVLVQTTGDPVEGDRIRFIENLDADVEYVSYIEQQITARQFDSIIFSDELSEPAGPLPNLVALPAHPPGPPAFPALFCDTPSPLRYAVIVRNDGEGTAGPSVTSVNRFEVGQRISLPTPALAPGAEVTLIFDFGTEAGVNTPFRVTVDVDDTVTEVDESDNSVEDECRIEP